MFAITPNGIGKRVGMRRVRESWIGSGDPSMDLAPNEFVLDFFDLVMVLAEDGVSLRNKTPAEEQQGKINELKNEARDLFRGYRESSTNIDGTTTIPKVDLDNYKTVLTGAFNAAKNAIQAETDITIIQNYPVIWPDPT